MAHLSDDSYTSPSELARHLNVTRATLSEALAKLSELEYVSSETSQDDERKKHFCLTEKGLQALSRSSVLDYNKLGKLLAVLAESDRLKAIEGLKILAGAAFVKSLG